MEILIIIVLIVMVIFITFYFGVKKVPQGEEWVVERLGKYCCTLKPGLNLIIPYIDYVRAVVPTKDITIDIDPIEVITKDNAVIKVDTIAFIRVYNPQKAIYGVDNYVNAMEQLIITTVRAIIGSITLDEALSGKEKIIRDLRERIEHDTPDWGITVTSFDIQEIMPPESLRQAMEKQAAAEREKRAIETMAEAQKKAAIVEAEGKLKAAELEAKAQITLAEASARSMMLINQGLEGKELPAFYLLGERYINTLTQLSQSENAKFVIYPADIQNAINGLFGKKKGE